MVANLSAHKRGWDERWEEFSTSAEDAQDLKERLMFLVDEDTRAFNRIMEAFSLPKNSPEEKSARSKAIQEATFYAIEVPFQVMETAFSAFPLLYEMADKGNPNSVSDAGVGALCVRAAVLGAWLNVQINASGYHDKQALESILKKAQNLVQETETWEKKIMSRVGEVMNAGSK
jgi:glutamate formiminotransferase/formiminotetrahydrofolate cyclodeaminase